MNLSEMYSIIVCSIRPDDAERLRANIEKTIGTNIPFEFLAYDNRNTGKGICQVYNECAAKARYEYLCFVHEDVEFTTEGWGHVIGNKLAEESCGVVGFAGSAMKAKILTGWNSTKKYGVRRNFIQGRNDGRMFKDNPYGQSFSQVVTLDGMCLFTARKVWDMIRFDDSMLKGFHCYDLDFTIGAAVRGFKNWVCNEVKMKHFSGGNIDGRWYSDSLVLHEKWKAALPLYVRDKHPLKKRYYEFRSGIEWMCALEKQGIYAPAKKRYVLGYLATHPFAARTYRFIGRWLRHRTR
jgi:hypothetical protein